MTEIGEVGKTVAANVERMRLERGLTYKRLSAALGDIGWPVFPLGLSRLERGERHVSVDDLAALGRVFDVDPASLLEPPHILALRGHPAVMLARQVLTQTEALALPAVSPKAARQAASYLDRAIRRLQLEIEEVVTPSHPSGSDQSANTRTLR